MNFKTYSTNISTFESNKVIRNTYALLGMTLLFSAFVAWISLIYRLPHPGFMLTLIGFYGLYFLTLHYSHSKIGVATAFLFTGFTGYTLGPMLDTILRLTANGSAIISMALTMTATVFLGLSAYVLSTRRDFSYMGGLIAISSLIAIVAALFSMMFSSAIFEIGVSCLFALVSSAYILFHTSEIVHGGERNYIVATLALYISIYNLFVSLLHIFLMFSGNNRD
jgi:modulator of FtsH protease